MIGDENTASLANANVNPKKRKGTPSEQDAAPPAAVPANSRYGQSYHKAGVGYGGSSGSGEDVSSCSSRTELQLDIHLLISCTVSIRAKSML